MKNFFLVLLCFLLTLMSGCTSSNEISNDSSVKSDDLSLEKKNNTFIKKFDDIILTVELDSSSYDPKDTIQIIASVENISNESIKYYISTGTPNMHKELVTSISNSDETEFFTDIDTLGKIHTDDVKIMELPPGEKLIQEMNFKAYYLDYSKISSDKEVFFPEGTYEGKCVFNIITDDTNIKFQPRVIGFHVVLENCE